MFAMVKSGFSQRRKTAANALSSQLGIEKQKIYDCLRELALPETARLEQLNMEQLLALADRLK